MSPVKYPKISYIRRTNERGEKEFVFQGYYKYTDPKTGNYIEVFDGEVSDGSTGALDIHSAAWWVHDAICRDGHWHGPKKDPIGSYTAARILSDILRKEGRWARAFYWRWSTFAFGCHKVRKNGWWQ